MSKKVIVVDDSRTARLQVSNALIEAGFEVVEAVDGLDGVEKVATHRDAAMVICDVNMPNMDGLDMLTAVKQDPKAADLPFIMLTTEAQPELIQRAKQRGAKGWIVKPFKPALLVATVQKIAGSAS
jgi:two-component system, chemotaxis family, chemotaxis protein CheY